MPAGQEKNRRSKVVSEVNCIMCEVVSEVRDVNSVTRGLAFHSPTLCEKSTENTVVMHTFLEGTGQVLSTMHDIIQQE